MKKILVAFIAFLCLSFVSNAQDKKAATPKSTTSKKAAPAAKPAAGPLKKDGTPDMRYKENKEAAKPAGPLKKDGTPDKRFKANKEAAKKKG